MSQITAVYPGTFDPLTNGHSDIVFRATKLFSTVIVAVAKATGPSKRPLFTFEERIEMAKKIFSGYDNIQVVGFDNLLVNFMSSLDSFVIIRGLRAVSDFEYEFQMAGLNRHLKTDIETVFLTPSEKYSFVSSSMVKEAAMLGGDVSLLVDPLIHHELIEKRRNRG